MSRVAIYGAGGFGKETRMLVEVISIQQKAFSFAGFIDDFVQKEPQAINGKFDDVAIAIADTGIREKIYGKIKSDYSFAPLIHPQIYVDKSNKIGKGVILCAGVQLTVNIQIGDFVIINLGATVGHDVEIGDFTSIMPSVNISGSVVIGKNVFVGSGATILQGLHIGDHAIIGAGAVVTKSVLPGKKVAGVPAKGIGRK